MTVLTIRAHKRFGVCRGITVHDGRDASSDGLLIEVSLEGFRLSNIDSDKFDVEDHINVEIEGWKSFGACVRWQHDGMMGLRLMPPLHNAELVKLVNFCRDESERNAFPAGKKPPASRTAVVRMPIIFLGKAP